MERTRLLCQIQSLRERAVKQRLDNAGRPAGPVQALTNWAQVVRTGEGEYPEKLYDFLFSGSPPGLSDKDRPILSLQIMPSDSLASVREILRPGDQDNETTKIDWMQVLPWETMLWAFWKQSGNPSFSDWLGSSQSVSIVRSLWNAQSAPPAELQNGLMRILVAWAQPAGAKSLQVENQLRHIADAVKRFEQEGLPLQVIELENAALETLCEEISTKGPFYIVHLVAHGLVGEDGVTRLLLATEKGQEIREHMRQLRGALQSHLEKWGTVPALFILNACLSDATDGIRAEESVAKVIAQTGVPYVIANQAAIKIPEMLVFTEAFYQALSTRQPVDRAVQSARKALLKLDGGEDLRNTERTLSPVLQEKPQLIPLHRGLSGWAVPVLYMHRGSDGYLPKWKPHKRIVWPLDGKIMVLVGEGESSFYVDECPVTQKQYERAIGMHGKPPEISEDSDLASVEEQDNGKPMVGITPLEAWTYAEHVKKRLPTPEQWLRLVQMDENYDSDGTYTVGKSKPEEVGNLRGSHLKCVRNSDYGPQHAAGLMDFVGNTFEIVREGEEQAFYRVSSSYNSKEPIAYSGDVRSIPLPKEESWPTVGFRTTALWKDFNCLIKSGLSVVPLEKEGGKDDYGSRTNQ